MSVRYYTPLSKGSVTGDQRSVQILRSKGSVMGDTPHPVEDEASHAILHYRTFRYSTVSGVSHRIPTTKEYHTWYSTSSRAYPWYSCESGVPASTGNVVSGGYLGLCLMVFWTYFFFWKSVIFELSPKNNRY